MPRCGGRVLAYAGDAPGALAPPAVAGPARPRLRRVASCRPGSDCHAGHVRLGRQGHRQPAGGYVRGVRVVRDAAPGRLRRPDGGTAPGGGSARRDRRGVRLPGHAGFADRVARGRGDGGGGVLRDLCWRGQLGAGRGDHGAAAGVHLAGVAGRSGVGRARPAGRLGDGRRRRAGGGGAAVARASARPAAWCRGRRLPGAGRPAACGGRVPAQRDGRTICAGSRSRGCAGGPGRRGAAQCLPGDALPPDRAEHSRSDDRAPGRRADLAEQHCHSAWAAPRRRQPRGAEGQGGRGRGSRPCRGSPGLQGREQR